MTNSEEKTIPVFIISDWNRGFENAKSRGVDLKSYGQYMLKQGRGYCRLMMEKDGASIYGTFIALAGIVHSKHKPRTGYLTETGDETGYPLSFEDMAAITRIPIKIIKRALTVLSSRAVGWIHADTMRIPRGYHEDTAISAQYTGIVRTVSTVSTVRISEPEADSFTHASGENAFKKYQEYWNKLSKESGLPKVEALSKSRINKLKTAEKQDWFVKSWQRIFRNFHNDKWRRENKKAGSFDILFQKDNLTRFLEVESIQNNPSARQGSINLNDPAFKKRLAESAHRLGIKEINIPDKTLEGTYK